MNVTTQTVLHFLIGVAIAAAVLFLVWYFSSIVIYILVSAILAIMGRPLVSHLEQLHIRRVRFPRWLAALITLVVIWALFAGIFTFIGPLIFHKIYQLSTVDFGTVIEGIEEPLARMQHYINNLFAMPDSKFSLTESLVSSLKSIVDYETINRAFSSIVHLAMETIITIFSISFITFFFMKEDGLFYSMVSSLFPSRYQSNVEHALDSVTNLLSRYFTGLLTESLILTTVISLTMMAFGMKAEDAFFIGAIMGVMNVVPYAGPLIGGIIAVFMGVVTPIQGMTVGHTMFVIAGSLLVIKGFDDFVLQPTIYSGRVKAHPLEIFIVILIAGYLAGIIGMLLAIPSYTVIRVFAKEFFSEVSLVRKLTQKI